MITVALAAALITVAWSLWIRRHAWRNPWEYAANLTIVFQATALTLTSPPASRLLSGPLHWLTGMWNFEDFIGHTFYVFASATIAVHALSRFTSDAGARFRRFLPHIIGTSLLIQLGLFMSSRGARTRTDDFMALPEGPYLAAYWLVLCGTVTAIMVYAAPYFWKLCEDPKHRPTAILYLGGIAVGVTTCLTRMLQAVTSDSEIQLASSVWMGCCVAVAGFALVFGKSWRIRKRDLFEPPTPVGPLG